MRGAACLGALLLGSVAGAATVCVNPLSAACQPTIQAGVDAANAGDIVKIAAGTYFENVTVPAGKDGLQILGAGKTTTILDASPYVDALKPSNTGPGITINSRNVTVKSLTIRNGLSHGIVIGAPGALIQGLNINGPDTAGVTTVTMGWNARIIQNDIRNTAKGVLGFGFGPIVQANVITGASIGIQVQADGAQVLGNKVYNGTIGIQAVGDGAVISGNDVQHQFLTGVYCEGSLPTIQGNKILGASMGIVTLCVDCFGGAIASNTVTDTTSYGVTASADGAGLLVQGNVLLRTGLGFTLNGVGINARLNKVSDVGIDVNGHCFEVLGSLNTVAQNTATRCSQAGVYVNGDDMLVDRNVVKGTYENGVTVDGDSGGTPFARATVIGNKTTGNAGQGVAVIGGAVDTLVTGNTATGNRHDFCDDGTSTDLGANTFGTTHPDCLIAH
jgi:hypothetical protein